MGAVKLALFALTAAAGALIIRSYRPELSFQIGLASGLLILLYAIEQLSQVYTRLSQLVGELGIPADYIEAMLKIIGIVYLVQFAADACRDAGETGVASKTELAGRVMILAVCVPMIKSVFELILSLAV